MNEQPIDRLRNAISRFAPMSDADWALLANVVKERVVKKGELFAEEGKTAKDVGYMLEGAMRHYYTRDGEERTTYFYFEGHFVASYISCIKQAASDLTIEAMSDCRVLVFKYKDLYALYDQSHTWERFGRVLAEYLAIGLEERMIGLLTEGPEERYLKLLSGNKTKILERVPQHYIASYLGITPVSLSRIRNRLTQK